MYTHTVLLLHHCTVALQVLAISYNNVYVRTYTVSPLHCCTTGITLAISYNNVYVCMQFHCCTTGIIL